MLCLVELAIKPDFIDNHQDFCLRVVFKPTFRAAVLAEKLTLLRAPILSLSVTIDLIVTFYVNA